MIAEAGGEALDFRVETFQSLTVSKGGDSSRSVLVEPVKMDLAAEIPGHPAPGSVKMQGCPSAPLVEPGDNIGVVTGRRRSRIGDMAAGRRQQGAGYSGTPGSRGGARHDRFAAAECLGGKRFPDHVREIPPRPASPTTICWAPFMPPGSGARRATAATIRMICHPPIPGRPSLAVSTVPAMA